MASVNGVNYAKVEVTVPSEQTTPGELHGRVRMVYDEITLAAEAGNGDTINFPKLPAGARVVGASLVVDGSLGAGGVRLGHAASADASISADADAFVSLCDASASAAQSEMGDGTNGSALVPVAGHLKKFDEEVQILGVFTAASTTGTGKTIKAAVFYVLD